MSNGQAAHTQLQEWALRLKAVMQEIDDKSMRWLELAELSWVYFLKINYE